MVWCFFRHLTGQRLRRGTFHDVEELEMAIRDYIDEHNNSPRPLVWTAEASGIPARVTRTGAVPDVG